MARGALRLEKLLAARHVSLSFDAAGADGATRAEQRERCERGERERPHAGGVVEAPICATASSRDG